MSKNKQRILRILGKINDPVKVYKEQKTRQSRLKDLVDKYGIEDVALASGLSITTLKQYLRIQHPVSITERSVEQAEVVLSQL